MRNPEHQQQIEYRRQQIIEAAVSKADYILMENADGSVEELNYLTAKVAEKFMQKALNPFSAAMLKKDLGV